ncbi:hypothetical protein SEUCBS139899_002134 [Sporothrix eucalyptigena]|uniref:Zn(2)-C6 fungal-type domain-containing protein n=1 Tax=Sporothrix eucalyptigena TaxID=1812306 RepID=A0ABP0B4I3_9PEZI
MGRAPTSGNCHTCRQRRVKCDKARPACARCVRGGFVCQGYETVLRMQNHAVVAGAAPGSVRLAKVQDVSSYPRQDKMKEITPPKTVAVPRTAAMRIATATSQPTIARQNGTRDQLPASAVSQSSATASSLSINPFSSTHLGIRDTPSHSPLPSPHDTLLSFMPQELSLVGFVDDMAFSYFFQAYGWINMHSLLLQDSSMRGHLLSSTESSASSPGLSSSSSTSTPPPAIRPDSMAQDSLRALCYGLLGRDKHIPVLQDAGRRVYGKAIADLRTALATPSKEELANLVKPISLLGAYSVTIEKDRRFTHHAGLARILEVCGPEQFQNPTLLPIFESARMTLLADAFVRRQHMTLSTSTAFLDQPSWKTVPWALNPSAKSATNRLLDVLSGVPAIIQGTWDVFNDRVEWLAADQQVPRIEKPDAVATLQAKVKTLRAGASAWRRQWTALSPDVDDSGAGGTLAERLLAWAYAQASDDLYRPGLYGVQGPDFFRTSLNSVLTSWSGPASPPLASLTISADTLATHMQDAALYTTVLVWADRLDRYLSHAARSPTCVDFFSTPFRTRCRCSDTIPPTVCSTVPTVDLYNSSTTMTGTSGTINDMAWNSSTCTMAGGPVRCMNAVQPELEWPSPATTLSSSPPVSPSRPSSSNPSSPSNSMNLLLPGDIRFVAHMRILSWLCGRLPATRAQVLATLSAIGLAHCAHDVRPAEGHADIAAVAVARVFDSTGIDGASNILLRTYSPPAQAESCRLPCI